MPPPPVLTRWMHQHEPNDDLLEDLIRRQALEPQWWSNAPGDTYAEHEHSYDKVLYCAEGTITFTLTPTMEQLALRPGDRLDLPAGWPHAAVVGTHGVRCVEAHRASSST